MNESSDVLSGAPLATIVGYMDLKLPGQLGIWRIGSKIQLNSAHGVFRAQPADALHSPRWDYVIKVGLHSHSRSGIERSIAVGAMVSHPNVVPVLDGDVTHESPYLVMPLLDGRTMKWQLAAGTSKPLPVALWLVRQLCQGLAVLHDAGWTHGDVKPENLIVGSNGHLTLLDLSFAHEGTMSQATAFQGTPEYAAPELLANASAGSPASDVFAAGRVLWEWLARVETKNEFVLSPICELVERMVDENPARRPSAGEVTQSLLRLEIDTLGEHIVPSPQRRAA